MIALRPLQPPKPGNGCRAGAAGDRLRKPWSNSKGSPRRLSRDEFADLHAHANQHAATYEYADANQHADTAYFQCQPVPPCRRIRRRQLATPLPTNTPAPTSTPMPTNTPMPTSTATATPTIQSVQSEPAQAAPLQAEPQAAPQQPDPQGAEPQQEVPTYPDPQQSDVQTWVDGTNCFWWTSADPNDTWKVREFDSFLWTRDNPTNKLFGVPSGARVTKWVYVNIDGAVRPSVVEFQKERQRRHWTAL